MNVLFFLTPKSEVAYLKDEWTLRQGIEKLQRIYCNSHDRQGGTLPWGGNGRRFPLDTEKTL